MIYLKTDEEIELLRESNLLVGQTLGELAKWVAPGVTTLQLDRIAEEFIRDHQAVPGFLGYAGYPNTLCVSVNEQIVHGIPSDYTLKEGDIVSIDCGVVKNGCNGDSAYTFEVGEVPYEVRRLLKTTKEALYLGIEQAVEGKRVGDISNAIQTYCEHKGYSRSRQEVARRAGSSQLWSSRLRAVAEKRHGDSYRTDDQFGFTQYRRRERSLDYTDKRP